MRIGDDYIYAQVKELNKIKFIRILSIYSFSNLCLLSISILFIKSFGFIRFCYICRKRCINKYIKFVKKFGYSKLSYL